MNIIISLVKTNFLKEKEKMPIALAPLNTEMKVVKILVDDKTKKHLESLGILINSIIKVISSVRGGVVIAVKEGRLALDRSIASKILVA